MNRPFFLQLPRPIVTCIMKPNSVEEALATIRSGEFDGAPAFAIHFESFPVSELTDENFKRIANSTKRPIMFLRYRGSAESNPWPLSEEERVEMLIRAAKCGAAAVDFTADTFDPSPLEFTENEQAVEKQKHAIQLAHEAGAEVIMSSHIYQPRTCEQVLKQMKAVEARGADFAKIVTMANTEEEFVDAVHTTMVLRREMKVPFIHLVSGNFAYPHRFLSPKLGNALTFCVHDYTPDFVTVQPPVRNMLTVLNNLPWNIDYVEGEMQK